MLGMDIERMNIENIEDIKRMNIRFAAAPRTRKILLANIVESIRIIRNRDIGSISYSTREFHRVLALREAV